MSTGPERTRKEIASRPDETSGGPVSPLGDILYKRTCTVRLRSPLDRASGTHRESGIVHSMRGDKCVIRRQETPDDPKTPGQLRRRATLGEISARWHTLPADVRAAWQNFATDRLAGYLSPFCKPGNRGQNAWGGAQICRLGMGLGYCETPPSTLPPAGRITSIEELPPLTPGGFRFRLSHDIPAAEGLRVLFQITRPLLSPRRKARDNQFVWAAQSDPESFLPLRPGGSEYEIALPAVEVSAGAPYAVRARLVTTDGFRGVPTTVYLVRAGDGGETRSRVRVTTDSTDFTDSEVIESLPRDEPEQIAGREAVDERGQRNAGAEAAGGLSRSLADGVIFCRGPDRSKTDHHWCRGGFPSFAQFNLTVTTGCKFSLSPPAASP